MAHDKLALIRETFRLEGEDIIRIATGRVLKANPDRQSYAQVTIRQNKRSIVMDQHVVKFALAHGFIPPRVDHEDGNQKNNLLANLRAATPPENAVNRHTGRVKANGLPIGVARQGRKFRAYVTVGKQISLGVFPDAETAGRVAARARLAIYGEFFNGPR